jgi:hypothetical protein
MKKFMAGSYWQKQLPTEQAIKTDFRYLGCEGAN